MPTIVSIYTTFAQMHTLYIFEHLHKCTLHIYILHIYIQFKVAHKHNSSHMSSFVNAQLQDCTNEHIVEFKKCTYCTILQFYNCTNRHVAHIVQLHLFSICSLMPVLHLLFNSHNCTLLVLHLIFKASSRNGTLRVLHLIFNSHHIHQHHNCAMHIAECNCAVQLLLLFNVFTIVQCGLYCRAQLCLLFNTITTIVNFMQ